MACQPSLVVNDYAGHPFQIELSTEFARRGIDVVHAYCATNVTPRADLTEREGGPTIIGISTGRGFDKYKIGRRLLSEVQYGIASAQLLWRVRPDACLNSNVPIVSLVLITLASTALRIRPVLWLQDLQAGLVAFALGSDRHPVARSMALLERWCIRRAAHVVTISEGFEREVIAIGVPESQVTTLPNWAPIEDLPSRPRVNEWSGRHGLDDRFVFLYSGTLGLKHRPEALVALAQATANQDPDAVVVVVSEGVGADWLEGQVAELHLDNVILLPFQPFNDLPNVLASGDALVVLLEPDAGEFSVPSKVLTYLCSGRAVVGLMPAANAASTLVQNDACAGLVSDDLDGFIESAGKLLASECLRESLGQSGRAYAEETFKISRIADDFLAVLTQTLGTADANGAPLASRNNGVMT